MAPVPGCTRRWFHFDKPTSTSGDPRANTGYRIHRVRLDVVEPHITDRQYLGGSGIVHQHPINEHNPACSIVRIDIFRDEVRPVPTASKMGFTIGTVSLGGT